MENQQEVQLKLLKTVLEQMDLGINRLVIAENGTQLLSSLRINGESNLVAVLIREMTKHEALANLIKSAAERFDRHQKPVNDEETKLADLDLAFRKLPKNHCGISVISDGDTLMVYKHGDMIEISANLCEAQQKDQKLRLILQSAVDVFRMNDEPKSSTHFNSSDDPVEFFLKQFREHFKGNFNRKS